MTTNLRQGKLVLIVLDGVGIGALPDADLYGDQGANTVGNTARALGGLELPNLGRLGFGNLTEIQGTSPTASADGCFGRMAEWSAGKDSTTGHWELAGIVTERPFPIYPRGFPPDVIERFLATTGCSCVLGNIPASGTEIINKLGDEHVRTGAPIVYTSGDSVLQIAAHEEVIPLPRLYEICRKARDEVMTGPHRVGRVIARPFKGTSGSYTRTTNRKDFALEPPRPTVLDLLVEAGIPTVGIGKVDDLFAGRGLVEKIHTKSNDEGVRETIRAVRSAGRAFVMTNLIDFDTLYGHRQDPAGLAWALRAFDDALPMLIEALGEDDLLMITSDHGNDPTDRSTDHSREYVPILCFSGSGRRNVDLGTRSTFADAGRTVAEYFAVQAADRLSGTSFLGMIA